MTDLVQFHVEPPPDRERNRWTALFRPILVFPHALLVGGPFFGVGAGAYRTGALGFLAITSAILDWFAILFTGHPISGPAVVQAPLPGLARARPGLRLFPARRVSAVRRRSVPRDARPPEEPATRAPWAVGLRLLLLVPHLIVLFALLVAALVVWVVSWVWVVATGGLAHSLWRFNRDVMGYALRVEAYGLLIHDQFPSFDVFSAGGRGAAGACVTAFLKKKSVSVGTTSE